MPLNVNNISFGYSPEKLTLKDISFTVEDGKTLGILGVSGTGKSTLLKLIAGFLEVPYQPVNDMHITFNNAPIRSAKFRRQLSFMFQEPTLMPNLTVMENIVLPFKLGDGGYNDDGDFMPEILRVVGLENFKDYYPAALSGGMKTRVALARSFVTNPRLLLLDEPFSSLDIGWKNKLYGELKSLQALNGTTVLMVSHDLDEIAKIADKVIVIGLDGSVIFEKDFRRHLFPVQDADELRKIILSNYQTVEN